MLSYDVIEWGKALAKSERETPSPRGTEVLLRLKYCGVCHSDVHIRDGHFELGGGKRMHMSERGITLPVTLGHEPYGTIIAAGPKAGNVPMGADRLIYPWIGCGACPRCREGIDNHCGTPRYVGLQRPGAYADHLLVPHPRYLMDTSGVDPVWASTLSCSGLASYSAVSKLASLSPDEWVAVIGLGGLGLMAIAILRAFGHERIIAVDIDETKLKAAGVAETVDARKSEASKEIQRIGGGAIYGAIDLVGTSATAGLALSALRKGGRLILVGLYGGEISLSLVATIQRALTIHTG